MQATVNGDRPRVSWTKAFDLFCQGYSFRSIAAELGCSPQSVWEQSRRCQWNAKREAILERLPKSEAVIGNDTVITQLITYQPTELERIESRIAIADEQLQAARVAGARSDVAALLRCLDQLSERKRIVLGVPLPGAVRRNDSGRRARSPALPVIDVTDKPTT